MHAPYSDDPGECGIACLEKEILEEKIKLAWSTRRENELGSVSPGKWADLTVYSQDLFSLTPDRWTDVETEMTVVNGEVVYRKA